MSYFWLAFCVVQVWIQGRAGTDALNSEDGTVPSPLLMDLAWDETSPFTVASQYLSSMLGTVKFHNHPAAAIMGRTITESGLQAPEVLAARCTIVAAATQVKLREDMYNMPPWKFAGIPDQRRPAADRDSLYAELTGRDPRTLDKGLSAAIQTLIRLDAKENDGLVDDAFYKDVLALWVLFEDSLY